jgi:hypothetical protein
MRERDSELFLLEILNSKNIFLLEKCSLVLKRRFMLPNDPDRYAGGSISSSWIQPYQTCQRVGERQSPWSSRLGVGCGANDPLRENILSTSDGGRQHLHTGIALVKYKEGSFTFMHVVNYLRPNFQYFL